MNIYSEYYLSKKAERFVNKIWVLDNSQNEQHLDHKMVLPNGCFNVAIVTGNGVEVIIKSKRHKMHKGIYLSAQISQKAIINIQARTRVIIIQLHAWSLSLFPNYNLTKFLDDIIQLDPGDLPFLNSIQAEDYADIDKIIALTNKNSEELCDNNPEKTPAELMCINTELQNERIPKTVEGVDYTNRALQIIFKKSTGLTRKQYSKIINLRKTVDYISQPENDADNLTSIAYRSGYFDQTHFIKTFKEIVNITPKKFELHSFFLSQIR